MEGTWQAQTLKLLMTESLAADRALSKVNQTWKCLQCPTQGLPHSTAPFHPLPSPSPLFDTCFWQHTQLAQTVDEGRGDVLGLRKDMTKIISLLQHQDRTLPSVTEKESALAAAALSTSRNSARYSGMHCVSTRAAGTDPSPATRYFPSEYDVASPYLQTLQDGTQNGHINQVQISASIQQAQLIASVEKKSEQSARRKSAIAISQLSPVMIPCSPALHESPTPQRTVPALSNMGGTAASSNMGGTAASAGLLPRTPRSCTAATTAPAAWLQSGEVILAISSPRTPVSPPPAHLVSGSYAKAVNGAGSYSKGEAPGLEVGWGLHRKVRLPKLQVEEFSILPWELAD